MVQNRHVYMALGINVEGKKEVLDMWIEPNECVKFWLKVVTERGSVALAALGELVPVTAAGCSATATGSSSDPCSIPATAGPRSQCRNEGRPHRVNSSLGWRCCGISSRCRAILPPSWLSTRLCVFRPGA